MRVSPTTSSAATVRLAVLWLQSDLPPSRDVFTRAAQAAFRRLDVELAERLAAAVVAVGAGVEAELLRGNTLMTLSRGEEGEELLKSLTARPLPEPAWSTAVNLRADNLLWPLGQPERSRQVIDDAVASASGPVLHRVLAFRAVQQAVEGYPADALTTCETIDRSELGALPELKLACAQTIALGDRGHPQQAMAIADKAAQLTAAAPEAAFFQAVILAVYQTQALIVGGCLPEAVTVAASAYRQWAAVPGIAQTFAAAISGTAALATGTLNTAVERLRSAVTDFGDRTDGGAYHFGIDLVEALARSGNVDAAAEALAQMQRNRHPAHAYRESDSLLAAAWAAAARGRTTQARD